MSSRDQRSELPLVTKILCEKGPGNAPHKSRARQMWWRGLWRGPPVVSSEKATRYCG